MYTHVVAAVLEKGSTLELVVKRLKAINKYEAEGIAREAFSKQYPRWDICSLIVVGVID